MKPSIEPSFTALVGIDWSDRKHDFCLQAAGSSQREVGVLEHSPEAIALWAKAVYRRFGGPIAVCLEIAKGPLVYALQRYESSSCCFRQIQPRWRKYREAVCCERDRCCIGGSDASPKMRVGPSKPACKSRLQTASSCVG
ncbi:MAG: hypothetical protein IPF60_07415 [Betaproteobacteria bacterium]|nr:hypothetical protein [Betaproteobacteria bacterium]